MTNQNDVTGSGRHDLDIWHVKLANGETRALSLDELDAGFHEGWINEGTLVLPAGAIRWAPLGEVAGLDETPPPVSSMPNSIAPYALDTFGADSGSDIPFDLDVPLDAESDADVLAFRPRRGRKVLKVMTALVVVAGLGFAALRGRPALQRALASRDGARTSQAAAAQPPPAPSPVQAAPPPPAAPIASQAIPTMTATALPNVPNVQTPAEKKAEAAKAKKAVKPQSVRK